MYDSQILHKSKKNDSKGIVHQSKSVNRKTGFGSMYKQEEDFTPDYYDSVKIADDFLKTKKRVKPLVDMKKQTKRDFGKMWQNND